MNRRQAFTLVELLVVVAIIAIVFCMVAGLLSSKGCSSDYYKTETTLTYRCVKFYQYNEHKSEGSAETSKRVDVQEVDIQTGAEIGNVVTFTCDDDYYAGVDNSAELYAQFQPDRIYRITTVGTRKTGYMSYFPNVTSVSEIKK